MTDDRLTALQDAGILDAVDTQLARTLDRLHPGQPESVRLGAAFASRAVGLGHVCADLRRVLARPLVDLDGSPLDVTLPSIFEWVMQLGQSPLCGDGDRPTPLVFDGEARIYLWRYWCYQSEVADSIRRRIAERDDQPLDIPALRDRIDRLLPGSGPRPADPLQRLAALSAARHRFAVITGGPGTGKTTTVVRILALLVEQQLDAGAPAPRIVLLAPTGKAAARLAESVTGGLEQLACSDEVKRHIPSEAFTIHRRLGVRRSHPTSFLHDRDNPLPADVVVVDETSMVDLALMAKVLAATPLQARLMLLGDRDQLASVEAGTILGDICVPAARRPYSRGFSDLAHEVLGHGPAEVFVCDGERHAADGIVELTHSFRFDGGGRIGRMAAAIKTGRTADAIAILGDGDPNLRLVPISEPTDLDRIVRPAMLTALEPYLRARRPADRLAELARFRLLAAHRRGRFGADALNRMIEAAIVGPQARSAARAEPLGYPGRPIIITRNDYQLGLYNGDVGVLEHDARGRLRAFFIGADGRLRSVLPERLPAHETTFAMTVHKSQGSEFDDVALLLPPQVSSISTRELVYTAITRARRSVTIFGQKSSLGDALARGVDRASGLSDALWPTSAGR